MITDKKEFDNIIDDQLTRCKTLLNEKFKEYQAGDDMLSNFNNIAKMLDIEPITAWMSLWIKHVESIITRIHRGQNWPGPKWDEKITDCINYLLLLQCLLRQNKNSETAEETIEYNSELSTFEELPTLAEATKMEEEHLEKTGQHINILHR